MKKHLRVYLNSNLSNITEMALLACRSNFLPEEHKVTMDEFEAVFKSAKINSPMTYKNIEFNKFPTSLTIDETTESGTTCILCIELVQLAEIKE